MAEGNTKGARTMTRLIDADAVEKVLKEKHFRRVLDSDRWLIADIRKSIMDLPTIDAEPIIRCKDCNFLENAMNALANAHCGNTKQQTKMDSVSMQAESKQAQIMPDLKCMKRRDRNETETV